MAIFRSLAVRETIARSSAIEIVLGEIRPWRPTLMRRRRRFRFLFPDLRPLTSDLFPHFPRRRRDDQRPQVRPVAGFIHADENSHARQYSG